MKIENNNSKKLSITEQIVYQDLFKNGNNENCKNENGGSNHDNENKNHRATGCQYV